MIDFNLKTPVVFFIFNRPETTEKVFGAIAKAKPPLLLVVADGARKNKEGETDKIKAARAVINKIDWPCEVRTEYSEINMGCKKRISTGLDWVFDQVNEAIIIEDDCIPNISFFQFCEENLNKYKEDLRISMISGVNFQFGKKINNDSYYFSRLTHVWGWATWANRWKNIYDVNMEKWPEIKKEGWLNNWSLKKNNIRKLSKIYDKVYNGEIDTWDYQWDLATKINGMLTIIPNTNLITNIGFGPEATHLQNKKSEFIEIETEEIEFPLQHPIVINASVYLDERFLNYDNIMNKIIRKVIKLKNKYLTVLKK